MTTRNWRQVVVHKKQHKREADTGRPVSSMGQASTKWRDSTTNTSSVVDTKYHLLEVTVQYITPSRHFIKFFKFEWTRK
jgi:hypothetical protein